MKLDYILISFIVVTIFSVFVNASDDKSIPDDYPEIPVAIVGAKHEPITADTYVDPKAIENIKDCIKDGDVHNFIVIEYPDRIIITKNVSLHDNNDVSYFSKKSPFHSSIIYNITQNTEENLKKYPILDTKKISGDIECITYNIGKSKLNVVIADGYYISMSDSPVLDIKKISDNIYMILPQEPTSIEYAHVGKSKIMTEMYLMSLRFRTINFNFPTPTNGSILTDNIIRLEYDDGAIEHWKVRFTKEDIEKNITTYKNHNYEVRKLIWWNNIGFGSPIDHETVKSWDYVDSPVEPVYEYKFP